MTIELSTTKIRMKKKTKLETIQINIQSEWMKIVCSFK